MRRWIAALCLVPALALIGVAQPDAKKPPAFKLSADEQKFLEITNAERKKHDLPPLKPHPILFQVARAHAANMAKQEKCEHELDGKKHMERLKDAKYDMQRAGENVCMGGGGVFTMLELHEILMDSPKHRANILHDNVTEIGIGLGKNKKGEVYAAQIFAAPKEDD